MAKTLPHHLQTIDKPFLLTIFGASGDLAKLKIFPSLYEMARQNRMPKKYYIVGYGRTTFTKKEFQTLVSESIQKHSQRTVDKKILKKLVSNCFYFTGQYENPEDFSTYKHYQKTIISERKTPAHIAYFSTPPTVFHEIIKNLAETRSSLSEDIRLVIEKPFGLNKTSAEKLFHFVSGYFNEEQFYLLDHYLGKSSVQSILNMRRSNRILSNLIQGSEISNIQITAFEKVGVEDRISYFDTVGLTRDVIQSHLLQILALVIMDIPKTHTADSLQREKNNILEAIECPKAKQSVVVGQYSGYKKQPGVEKNSQTETFSAIRLFLDRQNWQKTPIYIRSGKKLHEKHTYVVIEFYPFEFQNTKEEPNRIIIEFYPNPKIFISLLNYQEGVSTYQDISSSTSIACNIEGCLPEHADLLLDVINGDRMHFLSFAEIISSWKIIDKLMKQIHSKNTPLHTYRSGSKGPKQQHDLLKKDGFCWYDLH